MAQEPCLVSLKIEREITDTNIARWHP